MAFLRGLLTALQPLDEPGRLFDDHDAHHALVIVHELPGGLAGGVRGGVRLRGGGRVDRAAPDGGDESEHGVGADHTIPAPRRTRFGLFQLQPQRRADACALAPTTLQRFDYVLCGKADKGLLRRFLSMATGLSRAQVTRLLRQHRTTGATTDRRGAPRRPFARRCTRADIGLPAETGRAARHAVRPGHARLAPDRLLRPAGRRCPPRRRFPADGLPPRGRLPWTG